MKLIPLIFLFATLAHAAPNLPAPKPKPVPHIETCTTIKLKTDEPVPGVLEAWGRKSTLWPQNKTLRVLFLNGSKSQQTQAWKRFQIIDALINLTFVQAPTGRAEIRVTFDPNGGHWSYVGTDCLGIPSTQPTMNLALRAGIFGDAASEWDRVALHEVLHAIGLHHEHQHPQAAIPWDEAKVIAYYQQTQGWTEQEIRFQVLNPEPMNADFIGTAFDPQSVMEYPVPKELTKNGFSVGWNKKLSPQDLAFVPSLYPAKRK